MSWREAAKHHFPDIPLEPLGRASVPGVPSGPGNAEAGTVGTLARQGGGEHDAHIEAWTDREERAAIIEFDGAKSRRVAERLAGLRD